MGNVLFQKKDLERARVAYQDAIERTDDPRAYNNLAWLYYTKGTNLDEAERLAKKAVELAPDEGEFKDTLRMITEKGTRKN
jgi:Flp pilus assembly protein TadD